MDESNSASLRLADEIRRSVIEDAWHGPSVLEALHGVTATQAQWRPRPDMHSIWELALHVAAWHNELMEVLHGRAYRSMPEYEQWRGVDDASPEIWQALLVSIEVQNRELTAKVAALSAPCLLRPIEERDYNLEFLLHGFAQHNAYHAGQITLLKRLAPSS